MREFARDPKTKFKVMSLDDEARAFPQSFDMRSARVRALLIFMFSLNPVDPSTHKALVADQILREYGDSSLPYVFPRAPKKTLSNPANRILIKRVPGVSVKDQLTEIKGSEIHFLSPHVIFENFGNVDQEDLGLDPPNQSKGIISASSAALNYLRFLSIRDSFLFPFQSFSLDRGISILRC